MTATITPIKHVITNCSRCDAWITDGQSTMTVTVSKETWRGLRGEMAEVEVENAKVQTILGHSKLDHSKPYLSVDLGVIRRAFEVAL